MINEIVNYMIDFGIENTLYGNYCFSFVDLKDYFKIEFNEETIDNIIRELATHEEIADIDYDEDEISLYFYTNYCPNLFE